VAAADEAWQLLLLTDGAVVTAAVAAALTAIVAACWQTIGGHAAEGHVDVTNETVEATCNVLECSEFPAVTVGSREGALGATTGGASTTDAAGITVVTSQAATGCGTERAPPVCRG